MELRHEATRQELIQRAWPSEGYRDVEVAMASDKSVVILMEHCRDLKKQKTCLRLVTFFLTIVFVGLFCLTIAVVVMKDTAVTGQRSPDMLNSAFSNQVLNPTVSSETKLHRWYISLLSVPGDNQSDNQDIKWKVMLGGTYIEERRAILINQTGFYFVYVKIDLGCHRQEETAEFHVVLRSWNPAYNKTRSRIQAREDLKCPSGSPRTVVVGDFLEFWEGDHVSVWIKKGFRLMLKSSFGAFRV